MWTKLRRWNFGCSARAYLDGVLSYMTIGKRDAEQALEIARTGELTHLQRVWTMSQAANMLMRTDKARALQILDDATLEARRIDGSDPAIREFDVAEIFKSLAHENYERALGLAQVLEREGPRANAVMAIALGAKK